MSFEEFIEKVLDKFCAEIENAEEFVRVRNDRENGRYIAKLPTGETLIVRPSSLSVTIRYGSHQLMAEF